LKKRLKLQEVEVKLSPRKQIFNEKNELINAKVEINRIGAEYAEKV
jgi:hypothetical protein